MARRQPERLATVLSELMARRGFARLQTAEAFQVAWQEVAGPLAKSHTRVGTLRGGVLEVLVANSTLLQELVFQKRRLLAALGQLLPEHGIREIRFRVGPVD